MRKMTAAQLRETCVGGFLDGMVDVDKLVADMPDIIPDPDDDPALFAAAVLPAITANVT